MRNFFKQLAGSASADTWERLLTYSILRTKFAGATRARVFEKREMLWEHGMTECLLKAEPITVVEYGVHQGYSIQYFAERNTHADSAFFGLDSFEGLPEDWGSMPKGSFDVAGSLPAVKDARIQFIKGWFQHTSEELLSRMRQAPARQLLVHYDADLYSSTLFALTQIASLRVPYVAIFDEFTGHESRALYNFVQAYNANVEFIGQTQWRGRYPQQVLCRITPAG